MSIYEIIKIWKEVVDFNGRCPWVREERNLCRYYGSFSDFRCGKSCPILFKMEIELGKSRDREGIEQLKND